MLEILNESIGRTLYHATLRKNVPSILAHGLWPSIGEFTKQAYFEDDDEDFSELVFAADKQGFHRCLSAIYGWLRQENISPTFENIIRYGAIVILYEGGDYFKHKSEDDIRDENDPLQVEPGDYYTDRTVRVSSVLTGKKLASFINRMIGTGRILRYNDFDASPKITRNYLIRKMIFLLGKDQTQKVVSAVQVMSDRDVIINYVNMTRYDKGSEANTALAKKLIESRIIEDQPRRDTDPKVIDWINACYARPDVDQLYLHGSNKLFTHFHDPNLDYGHLIHFTKLTGENWTKGKPLQAEYYGSHLYLVKLHFKKMFRPYSDPVAREIERENLKGQYDYEEKVKRGRLDYQDQHLVVPPAVAAGYDCFRIYEVSVRGDSFGVIKSNMVEIVNIY